MASIVTVSPTSGVAGQNTHTITVSGEHAGTSPVTHQIEFISQAPGQEGNILATYTLTRAGNSAFAEHLLNAAFFSDTAREIVTHNATNWTAVANNYRITGNRNILWMQVRANTNFTITGTINGKACNNEVRVTYRLYDTEQGVPANRNSAENTVGGGNMQSVAASPITVNVGDCSAGPKYVCITVSSGSTLFGTAGPVSLVFSNIINPPETKMVFYAPATATLSLNSNSGSVANAAGSSTTVIATADAPYSVNPK